MTVGTRERADTITADEFVTAFHEAGHALAAVLLGGRVGTAVLGDEPRVEYDVIPEGREAEVIYAGPWAEARFTSRRRPGLRDMNRVLDGTADDDELSALRAAGLPAAGEHIASLLERCWPAVERLAAHLLVAGRADHSEVCTALGISDFGGPSSAELAAIRAGLRTVS